jgi:protein SCO1/2
MPIVTRRDFVAAAAALPLAGELIVRGSTGKKQGAWEHVSGREVMRRHFFPSVTLTTHKGKKVRFYEDVLKGKIVVLNLMYADCTAYCPVITQRLLTAQKILVETRGFRPGRDYFFYSITVKPEEDTAGKLTEFAEMHKVGEGWTFLTGKPDDIELVRRKLGFADPDPVVDRDKSRHSGMIRYGNEPRCLWGAFQSSADPEWIAKEISFAFPVETKKTKRA